MLTSLKNKCMSAIFVLGLIGNLALAITTLDQAEQLKQTQLNSLGAAVSDVAFPAQAFAPIPDPPKTARNIKRMRIKAGLPLPQKKPHVPAHSKTVQS